MLTKIIKFTLYFYMNTFMFTFAPSNNNLKIYEYGQNEEFFNGTTRTDA